MLRIIIIAIIVCIISSVLKHNCIELYLPFLIAAAVILLIYIVNLSADRLCSFFSFAESIGVGFEIIESLIKAAFITVGAKLGCDVCKESGNHLLADIIELGGKIMIFVISVPYIISIIKISIAFIK